MQNHMWAQQVCSRVENIIIQIIWYSSDQQQQTLLQSGEYNYTNYMIQ